MASKYAIIVAALLAGTSPVLAQGGGGGGGAGGAGGGEVAGLLEARRLTVARDRHRGQRQCRQRLRRKDQVLSRP